MWGQDSSGETDLTPASPTPGKAAKGEGISLEDLRRNLKIPLKLRRE